MNKGIIVLLNGVSSSGKTTLSKNLQDKFNEVFYLFSSDTFCEMIHEKYLDFNHPEYVYQTLSLFRKVIKLYSDEGENVIVDTAMLENPGHNLYKEYKNLLTNNPVVLVKVICPIEELQRRELKRGDRYVGLAKSQIPILNPQNGYDIIVDTYNQTIDECSDKIIEYINKNIVGK
jgi:chloramphenicol 3-O phosphotransferase